MYRLTLLLLIFWSSMALPQSKETKTPIDSLRWMRGYWKHLTEGSEIEEQWMGPLNKLMVGMSRSTDTGMNASFDFMRIIQDKSGVIRYIAMPAAKKETVFTLTYYKNREVWFENPAHDFPRKIIYRMTGTSEILVRLEGLYDGEPYQHEYSMFRENCGD